MTVEFSVVQSSDCFQSSDGLADLINKIGVRKQNSHLNVSNLDAHDREGRSFQFMSFPYIIALNRK